ncbi:ribbon-helix-helix protein, CopG family [Mesorhizobium sp. M0965]|uniref:ribbon-helix-helix protein, CopG family n=1 Tax=Mesorhizobium sp. M0965 TaxID=2957036 RepID=UPI00333BDCA6
MTRPQEGFQRIAIAIPETLDRQIDQACARSHMDRGDWLRAALAAAVDREAERPTTEIKDQPT